MAEWLKSMILKTIKLKKNETSIIPFTQLKPFSGLL